jgi:hypothetical protein
LKRLFGKSDTTSATDPESNAIARVQAWTQKNPAWGWRIYRTRAGLRLLATHGLSAPDTSASDNVFDALDADPLYRTLCKNQKCFRARLSPKPWRIGVANPRARWPFADGKEEQHFKEWQTGYDQACAEWATCELIKQTGNTSVHPEVQLILGLHDQATRAESKLALA